MGWLSSEFLPGVLMPKSGTQAGTSWADMFFLAAFARVMDAFDARCDECGLKFQLSAQGAAEYFGIDIGTTDFSNRA
eukprot:7435953-Karenia_brevis.AAC.1